MVISSQSTFLRAACHNGFQEAQTGILDLPEEHEIIVAYMVKFFYLPSIAGCVPEHDMQAVPEPTGSFHRYAQPCLGFYVKLYILGDTYDIPRLCEDAREWVKFVLEGIRR